MANIASIKGEIVHVGDTVKVFQQITEEGKTRTQIFEGVIISIKGKGMGRSFTVRKISTGNIGVERIWPVASPSITKVQRVKEGKVRRSKLYYLRSKTGKKALKIKEKKELKVTKKPKPKIQTKTKTKVKTSAKKKSGS